MKLKRLAVPWASKRKMYKFITAPRGPHRLKHSFPLLFVVRDILKFADTASEARKIIKGRNVRVDGRVMKDIKYGVGLFDTIEIGGKHFRVLPGKRMQLAEIPSKEGNLKLCKIKDKHAVRGKKLQLNFHDGRNILVENNDYKVNDSVLIGLPEQKIKKHIKFESGVLVLIVDGKHAGELAKLKKYEKGINKRVILERGKQTFESSLGSVMAVGTEKPEVSLGGEND